MYLTNPTSFDKSVTEAELVCFNALVAATSTVAGKSAFLGQQPIFGWDKFTFGLTKSQADEPFWLQNSIDALCFNARATGVFANRVDALIWQSQIVAALPICSTGNVVQLQTTHLRVSEARAIEVPNESVKVLVWQCDVDFLVYLVTGGKSNVVAESESNATTEWEKV